MKNFLTSRRYISLSAQPALASRVPHAVAEEMCPKCKHRPRSEMGEFKVCACGHHYRIDARARLALTADPDSWNELEDRLSSRNFLGFPGYEEKLNEAQNSTGLPEGVITGTAQINGMPVVLAIMDYRFMGGSMGVVVGEKVVRSMEYARQHELPLILFSASGGARMQEGMAALMQMAHTAAAVRKLHEQKILYICVMTYPTTGGVSASFAALADVILAEPDALIGFTGPRVIQQTLKQPLPEGFQRAEFLLEHGMIDDVVPRPGLKSYLAAVLRLHSRPEPQGG